MTNEPLHVIVARIDENLKSLLEMRLDHETRLRSLEETRSQARGGSAVIIFFGGLLGTVGGWLVSWFNNAKHSP